jgi:hypothetical protein
MAKQEREHVVHNVARISLNRIHKVLNGPAPKCGLPKFQKQIGEQMESDSETVLLRKNGDARDRSSTGGGLATALVSGSGY